MNARLAPTQIRALLLEAEQHIAAGRLAEGEAACRRVLATAPNNPLATHYLGAIAFSVGQYDLSVNLLRRAAELEENHPTYWASLGEALMRLARLEESLAAYERAIALQPGEWQHHYRLGALAGKLGRVDRSLVALKLASQLNPSFPGAVNDLGITLTNARRMPEALDCFRSAMRIDPDYRTAYENLIYMSHFAQSADGMTIKSHAQTWAKLFADPLTAAAGPHENDRSPDRRIRIGYISPDLYEHPVGRFMQSILPNHDRGAFEVFCYSDVLEEDAVTQRLREASDHWLASREMSDDDVAAKICADRIDLLIDLSLHMGHNRLMVFARKPAPVQATYLGYAGTSGMAAMDWRISDPYLDPPGNDRFYTERTMRLARSYWCYPRPSFAAELGEVPLRDPAQPIVFACLNNIIKITDAAIEAWIGILRQVPDARMIIQGEPGEHLSAIRQIFERGEIDPARIDFAAKTSMLKYFKLLRDRVDIALDPFPYAGGTSTCDALWMGVPVVTLGGEIAVHRGGVSILTNLGVLDLITSSVEEYIASAVALAQDRARLEQLRHGLRPRMESSILMNPSGFVGDLEHACREIWREWCSH